MNQEKQRIAIAEACGWTMHNCGEPLCAYRKRDHFGVLPDYLSDLNAMHEAEKVLFRGRSLEDEGRRVLWGEIIESIAVRVMQKQGGSLAYIIPHLSAAQRAEAFLRTLNLYTKE